MGFYFYELVKSWVFWGYNLSMVNVVLTLSKVKIMKNVLLIVMVALFIACMGGVFVGIAAAMVGATEVALNALYIAIGTMCLLMPVVHVYESMEIAE